MKIGRNGMAGIAASAAAVLAAGGNLTAQAQEVLPFSPTPSGSTAGRTIQDSVYNPLPAQKHLSDGAPNVLIVLIDDAGPGHASTYGGEFNTPTLSRIANEGISYNRFHTTAMSSPTRAALLTGRNHHRVGAGQIAELANDWDGYSGIQPKTSAMIPEVLKAYGYQTAAWGKWHNTPASQTTAAGPFDYWPTGYGFEYFYGFLAGEASQWEPHLVRNTTVVHPNHPQNGKTYHVTEDIADDAITWLHRHKAFTPDKPFFMYWAPGAIHGPHHVAKEWADKYKGKFDDGWDKYRERVFARQKAMGFIPADAQLTPRPDSLPAWDSIPESERPFQRRLMETLAGFAEHTDAQVGRLVDEIDRLGYKDDTIVMYIWGDNGASAEGQLGTISELLAQNNIPSTPQQHIKALEQLGGLDVIGSPKTDNHVHAGWAWAGSTPYRSTKLVAGHLGGTRNPMAIRWPAKIKSDGKFRAQFTHCNDIVPTLYEVIGITPPRIVNGFQQDPFDGVSFAHTFTDPEAKGRKLTQYFEIMGSRAIYHDGWMASVFGPSIPWLPGSFKAGWTPDNDVWELYDLNHDWTQASDLAAKMPEKVAQMKELFAMEAARNKVYPIGGGLLTMLRPEMRLTPPYSEWTFAGEITRMPEVAAPKLGNTPNLVTVEADVPDNASGVLYALGSFAGGLSCYVKDGILSYEYNLFEIMRTQIKAKEKLPAGKAKIEIETTAVEPKAGGPMKISLKVNGRTLDTVTTFNGQKVNAPGKLDGLNVAPQTVPVTAALAFTANDCLDIGSDLGSPVSVDYFDDAPFRFSGKIGQVRMKYLQESGR